MEYTYEFLRECHGLRFRAKSYGVPEEGIVKVDDAYVLLCYGKESLNFPESFNRRVTRMVDEEMPVIDSDFTDFEIVPRDPETYKDWQMGDKVHYPNGDNDIVIFRSGELVVLTDNFTEENRDVTAVNTCFQLFDRRGGRLILTDIEQQIIEEKRKQEYEPQGGDIVAWKAQEDEYRSAISIYRKKNRAYFTLFVDGMTGGLFHNLAMNIVRPATDEEKQRLFDAMAKKGMRWNAEKNVVEDIPKESEPEKHDFKKFDPVLVRDGDDDQWEVQVFGRYGGEDEVFPYFIIDGPGYYQCIPLNEKTERLIYTNDDSKEELS